MKTKIASIAVAFLVMSAAAQSSERALADIVDTALDNIEWNFEMSYAFDETSREDDETLVGRYDPTRPAGERWTLLSVDGRAPTDDEIDEYVAMKDFEHRDVGGDDDGLEKLIKPGSLRLISETEHAWTIGFDPQFDVDDDDEKFLNGLDGVLRVSKRTGALLLMDMRNQRPLRPIVGAKIKKMVMRFEFGPATRSGPNVLKVVDVVVSGSALMLVRFDEHERYEFSNFEYVGDRLPQS